jgi:putative ABC transport system permease protein
MESPRSIVAGLILGLAGVVVFERLLRSQLYRVSSLDPTALETATTTLGAVALTACYVPARRATRIDPAIALRANEGRSEVPSFALSSAVTARGRL